MANKAEQAVERQGKVVETAMESKSEGDEAHRPQAKTGSVLLTLLLDAQNCVNIGKRREMWILRICSVNMRTLNFAVQRC